MLNIKRAKTENICKFANSVNLDEVAHYEPPHLDLYCLLVLQIRRGKRDNLWIISHISP